MTRLDEEIKDLTAKLSAEISAQEKQKITREISQGGSNQALC
jgi:restriction endonuclease S subunit